MLYRTGTIHVTSTVYDSALQETNRQTDPKTRLYYIFGWSLLISDMFKIKNVQSFKHYKQSFSFYKSNCVLFTCTIACTNGSHKYHLLHGREFDSIESHDNTVYGNRQYY